MTELHPAEAAYMNAVRAGTDWYTAADRAVAHLAAEQRPFTADDVRAAIDVEPRHPNAWGGLFQYWKNRGLIRHIGFTRSRGAARHGAVTGVWQGVEVNK